MTIPAEIDLHSEPPRELQQRLLREFDKLTVLPSTAADALELVKHPECSIQEFSRIVQRDAKLAADMLALANSAVFALPHPVLNLEQAVVRLGFRQCRNLIVTSSMVSLMQDMSLEQHWIREELAQHSFTTAACATRLNRALTIGFQGEEFTAGLMHDFGRLLLATICQNEISDADPLDFQEDELVLRRERKILGTDHCEVGAWIASRFKLPQEIVTTIRLHHQPYVRCDDQKLVALIAAADHMANHLQRTGGAEDYDFSDNLGVEILERLQVEDAQDRFSAIWEILLNGAREDTENGASQWW